MPLRPNSRVKITVVVAEAIFRGCLHCPVQKVEGEEEEKEEEEKEGEEKEENEREERGAVVSCPGTAPRCNVLQHIATHG